MPPKKVVRMKGAKGGKWGNGEPRVILRPLRSDASGKARYCFTAQAPTSGLFNKPEMSDIKLKVGDGTYYAHRLILCAASDVFAKMLGNNWLESKKRELTLQEDEESIKVFELFLQFFYTGTVIISESYVIPLFMLADKYNVKILYNECVRVIVNGLKVYVVTRTMRAEDVHGIRGSQSQQQVNEDPYGAGPSTSNMGVDGPYSSASSYSDSSDNESTEGEGDLPSAERRFAGGAGGNYSSSDFPASSAAGENQGPARSTTVKNLVASETFPLVLVMKMLNFCQNEKISNAALYNLEARLCCQLQNNNFGVWNDIPQPLLVRMLQDDFFYCNENLLFHAAKSWLKYKEERRTEEIMTDVLCCIRYPILTADDLYLVEKDDILQECPEACKLVREAVRYNLYRCCPRAINEENWTGKQFEFRQIKHENW